jgi:hypothetical protein
MLIAKKGLFHFLEKKKRKRVDAYGKAFISAHPCKVWAFQFSSRAHRRTGLSNNRPAL